MGIKYGLQIDSELATGATNTIVGPNLTQTWAGTAVVIVFITAYVLAASEEFTYMRKSKPMILGAGLIWTLLALFSQQDGSSAVRLDAALDRDSGRRNFRGGSC